MDKFKILGDVHLGRQFVTGVPLHRRGDREEMVWADFEKSLTDFEALIHVCMGDIFDKFIVSPEVVLRTADTYIAAAKANSNCMFYILRGNHDASKDSNKRSSFDILKQLLAGISNIAVVDENLVEGKMAFVPYCPFSTAVDQVSDLPDNLDVVFMHHDFVDFGTDHVIPTALLAEKGITEVVNGHDHLPRVETRHGVTVTMTGSMQPYTHAEDPTGEWYLTTTLEDIPEDCSNMNIRVLLKEGEDLPTDLDCLSLTVKRTTAETLEADTEDFENFDIRGALSEALHPTVREEVMEQYDAG